MNPCLKLAALLALASAMIWSCAPSKVRTKTTTFGVRSSASKPRINMKWRQQVRPEKRWGYRTQEFSTPAYIERSEELVVGTSLGEVARMRAGNADVIWRRTLMGPSNKLAPIHADPLVSEDMVYVASILGSVHALKLSTGAQLWMYETEDAIESALSISDGRLLFMDSREVLYALDAITGKVLWRYQRRTPEFFTIKGSGTPVIQDGVAYCGFADGTMVALNLDTGEAMWQTDLSNEQPEFTDIDMPAIIDGDLIYTASYAGGIYALRRDDGTMVWRVGVESVSRIRRGHNTLYATSAQGRLVAIDLETHKPTWSFRFKDATPVDLSVSEPYLFVSTSNGPLYILDATSGYALTRWAPSGGFNVPMVLHGHKGYLFSNGGVLYGLEITVDPNGGKLNPFKSLSKSETAKVEHIENDVF